jgi:cytochrome c oxidase subunit 2
MGFKTYIRSTVPPAESMEIRVLAQKWNWSYSYPKYNIDVGVTDSLVVPVNTPVRLQMSSKDVLHSYYVPEFRVKKDVVPNRYSTVWFEVNDFYTNNDVYQPQGETREVGQTALPKLDPKTAEAVVQVVVDRAAKEGNPIAKADVKYGMHQVFCTEYCGDHHSRMLSSIVVLSQEHFDLWIRAKKDFNPFEEFKTKAEVGAYLAKNKYGCTACHNDKKAVDGTGPTWIGLKDKERKFVDGTSMKATREYLKNSIIKPQSQIVAPPAGVTYGKMNNFEGMDENDLEAILDYIESL